MPKISNDLTRWFDYPDDPFGGRVEVLHLKKTLAQDLMGKGVDSKVIYRGTDDGGNRLLESETRVDNAKTRELLAVAVVMRWENFLGADGNPLDCTPDNVRLFSREDGFMDFLGDCRGVLAKEAVELEEAARKNSPALPPGSAG